MEEKPNILVRFINGVSDFLLKLLDILYLFFIISALFIYTFIATAIRFILEIISLIILLIVDFFKQLMESFGKLKDKK